MERIILKSMAKNPDDRFQSADAMLAQLGHLDTAELLAIPPASMAAGPAAHAATLAVPTGSAPALQPAQATRAASGPAADAGATRLGHAASAAATALAGPAAPGPSPAGARRLPMPLFAAAGVLVLILVLGGGAFAFTGGFGLLPGPTDTVAPTRTAAVAAVSETPAFVATPAPTATRDNSTPTPDLVNTQLASLQQTQAALQAAVASPTPSSTPDLTATAAACVFDFALLDQQPPDGRTLTVGAGTTKLLTLRNTGTCGFPEGTLLTEVNRPAGAEAFFVRVPVVAPEATIEVSFEWPGRRQPGQMLRVFELRRPGDLTIGLPLSFTYSYVPAATQRAAPTPTPVLPTQPPAPPTRPAAGLTDLYPEAYVGCAYQGEGSMDFNCTVKLGWVGGSGRMTLYVDGQQIGAFSPGESMFYNIVSRRCLAKAYNLRLVDDGTLTQISKDFYFDPGGNGGLFPGGACTLP
jgi:hypothetical protein